MDAPFFNKALLLGPQVFLCESPIRLRPIGNEYHA